jgi:hypothetical protein
MRLLLATTFVALTATAALSESVEPLAEVILREGVPAVIPDTDIKLILASVTDQRCPSPADHRSSMQIACFWEGMVRAEIVVMTQKAALERVVLCNLCDDGEKTALIEGLDFTLVGLAPSTEELAKLDREPHLADYELTLTYEPAQK